MNQVATLGAGGAGSWLENATVSQRLTAMCGAKGAESRMQKKAAIMAAFLMLTVDPCVT